MSKPKNTLEEFNKLWIEFNEKLEFEGLTLYGFSSKYGKEGTHEECDLRRIYDGLKKHKNRFGKSKAIRQSTIDKFKRYMEFLNSNT